ncbi:MAG TPA: Rieske (2Fe-2S) protein [Dermatophilaceae bacterium]
MSQPDQFVAADRQAAVDIDPSDGFDRAREGIDRRTVIRGAGVVGVGIVGVAALAACGASSDTTPSPPAGAASSAGSGGAAADAIKTADIPVGGGKVFDATKIVVTQPKAGEFKAFSAVCTHKGCTVAGVANGTITCPCHGSTYDATTGAVTGGPAPAPLSGKTVTVKDGSLTVS